MANTSQLDVNQDLFVQILSKRKKSGQVRNENCVGANQAPGGYLTPEELNLFDEFFVNCVAVYDEDTDSPLHEGGSDPETAMSDGANRVYYSIQGHKRDALSPEDSCEDPWWTLHDCETEAQANRICEAFESLLDE